MADPMRSGWSTSFAGACSHRRLRFGIPMTRALAAFCLALAAQASPAQDEPESRPDRALDLPPNRQFVQPQDRKSDRVGRSDRKRGERDDRPERRPRERDGPPPPGGFPPHDSPPPRGAGPDVFRPPFGPDSPRLLRRRFAPSEIDRGPLDPGEEDVLMEFARENCPMLFDGLDFLRERNPDAFRRRIEDMAPRIRFLQRLKQDQPGLGRLFLRHVESEARIRRMRREFESAAPEDQRAIARRARLGPISESVRLEIEIMELHVEELAERRDRVTDAEFRRLTAPDFDAGEESADIRGLIGSYHTADPVARPEVELRLRESIRRRIDDEIAEIQDRCRMRREAFEEETNRRTRRIFNLDRP